MSSDTDIVSFTRMSDATVEDVRLPEELGEQFARTLPDRVLAAIAALAETFSGFKVNRLEHSLQSATRAYNDGRDEEYVVAALVHDIGDELAPYSHGEMTAAVMRPYLPERLCWIVQHHPSEPRYLDRQ